MKRIPAIALCAVVLTASFACQTTQETRTEQDRRAEEWRRGRKGHYTTVLNGKHLPFDYTRYNLVVLINRGGSICGGQLIDELKKLLDADGTYRRNTAGGFLNIDVYIDSCKFRTVQTGTTTMYDSKGYWAGTKPRYQTEFSISGYLMFYGRTFGNFNETYIGSSRELYRRTAKYLMLLLLPVKQRVYVSEDPRDLHYKELMEAAEDTGKFAALLAQGRDPNASTWDGKVLLHSLIGRDHRAGNTADLVRLLLDKGADPGIKDINGYTPLHRAAPRKDTALLELLIARGAPVNAKSADGVTPLTIALNAGNREAAARLLEKGAVVDQHSQLYALKSRDASLAALLNKYPKEKFTAVPGEKLLAAIKTSTRESYEEALLLINIGVEYSNAEQKNDVADMVLTAYTSAVKKDSSPNKDVLEKIAKALLAQGVTVKVQYKKNVLLHAAVDRDDIEAAKLAIGMGADVNAGYRAIYFYHQKKPQFFPYHTKALSLEMFRLLEQNGASINFKSKEGYGILHIFIRNGPPKGMTMEVWGKKISGIIAYLVDRGLDPNEGNLLHLCGTYTPCPALAEALIKKGALLTARDRHGNTPLHNVLYSNHWDIVQVLLKHGSKVNEKNNHGKTPLMIAQNSKTAYLGKPDRKLIEQKQRIIALLKQYGAR